MAADLFQGSSDVGLTIPGSGMADYKGLASGSEKTDPAIRTAAANAAHLGRLLDNEPYPALS